MIRFLGVSKSYRQKRVLTDASHTIEPGRLTLLVGANGVGKSTLLRLIAGVECPNSGLLEVCGLADPARNSAARAALAYLPQAPQFHPRFNCLQLASFYARLRGTPSSRALAEIEYVGLGEECHTPSGELSGGMRQRLGIAILLASRAPVLLLDEPALSLDQVWRAQLIQRLRKEADDGATVLVTSHLLTEWKDTSDHVIECKDGRIEPSLSAMPRPTGPTSPTSPTSPTGPTGPTGPTARPIRDIAGALFILNPVDAFRIHALFTLEGMAPEEAAKSNLSSWWIANSRPWLVLVCSAWIALLLASVHRRLRLPS